MARYKIKKGDIKKKARGMAWRGSNQYIINWRRYKGLFFADVGVGWEGENAWVYYLQKGKTNRLVLNNYFKDWQNPTLKEILMFEIVTGEKYIHEYLGIEINE